MLTGISAVFAIFLLGAVLLLSRVEGGTPRARGKDADRGEIEELKRLLAKKLADAQVKSEREPPWMLDSLPIPPPSVRRTDTARPKHGAPHGSERS